MTERDDWMAEHNLSTMRRSEERWGEEAVIVFTLSGKDDLHVSHAASKAQLDAAQFDIEAQLWERLLWKLERHRAEGARP